MKCPNINVQVTVYKNFTLGRNETKEDKINENITIFLPAIYGVIELSKTGNSVDLALLHPYRFSF